MNVLEHYNDDVLNFVNDIDNFKKAYLALLRLFEIDSFSGERDLKFKEIIKTLRQDELLDDYDPKRYSIVNDINSKELLLDVKLWILNIDIVSKLEYQTYVYLFLTYSSLFNNPVAWYFCYRKAITFKQHLNIITKRMQEENKSFNFNIRKDNKEMFLYSFIEFNYNNYLREE